MALIILAGGKSSRMGGGNKAFLPIGKETMIGMIISRFCPFFTNMLVVAKEAEPYCELPVRVVSDHYAGIGPMGGIHAGLQASPDEYNFILGCDLPLMKLEMVQFMLSRVKSVDVVIPFIGGFIEPVAAVYTRRIIPVLEDFIHSGDYKMGNVISVLHTDYVPEVELRKIDPLMESFLNVNTPEDYQKVQAIVQRGESVD